MHLVTLATINRPGMSVENPCELRLRQIEMY